MPRGVYAENDLHYVAGDACGWRSAPAACIHGKGAEQGASLKEENDSVQVYLNGDFHCLGGGRPPEEDKDLSQISPGGSRRLCFIIRGGQDGCHLSARSAYLIETLGGCPILCLHALSTYEVSLRSGLIGGAWNSRSESLS